MKAIETPININEQINNMKSNNDLLFLFLIKQNNISKIIKLIIIHPIKPMIAPKNNNPVLMNKNDNTNIITKHTREIQNQNPIKHTNNLMKNNNTFSNPLINL